MLAKYSLLYEHMNRVFFVFDIIRITTENKACFENALNGLLLLVGTSSFIFYYSHVHNFHDHSLIFILSVIIKCIEIEIETEETER